MWSRGRKAILEPSTHTPHWRLPGRCPISASFISTPSPSQGLGEWFPKGIRSPQNGGQASSARCKKSRTGSPGSRSVGFPSCWAIADSRYLAAEHHPTPDPARAPSPARSAGAARSVWGSCLAREWGSVLLAARPAASPVASSAGSGAVPGRPKSPPGPGRRRPPQPWPLPRLHRSPPAQLAAPGSQLHSPTASFTRPRCLDGRNPGMVKARRAGRVAVHGPRRGAGTRRRRGKPTEHLRRQGRLTDL